MTTVNESINHCVIAIRKQINCVITSCPRHLQVVSSKSDKSFKRDFAGSVRSIAAAATRARVYIKARSEPATAKSVQQARESSGRPAACAAVPVVAAAMSLALLAAAASLAA